MGSFLTALQFFLITVLIIFFSQFFLMKISLFSFFLPLFVCLFVSLLFFFSDMFYLSLIDHWPTHFNFHQGGGDGKQRLYGPEGFAMSNDKFYFIGSTQKYRLFKSLNYYFLYYSVLNIQGRFHGKLTYTHKSLLWLLDDSMRILCYVV